MPNSELLGKPKNGLEVLFLDANVSGSLLCLNSVLIMDMYHCYASIYIPDQTVCVTGGCAGSPM